MTEKFENSLRFVAKHYRRHAFSPTLMFARVPFWKRRSAVAAAVSLGILVVSASVYLFVSDRKPQPASTTPFIEATQPSDNHNISKVIVFNDASISEVAKAIEDTYGVTVTGVDPSITEHLTLRYDGTATDLVETINLLLGTDLQIIEN